ncbi:MAG: acetylornithine deacetylase [Gammaproteobacteria bacterium]|nr:acetylornithine deacetylase [Gammaproteobacteria bacterium]
MGNRLPTAHEMIKELIGIPSVSCVHADLDMSNRGVIDRVAEWSEGLGFEIEIQSVNNEKFNLVARAGSGSDGLVVSGHTDTVPCDPSLWSSDPFTAREADERIYGLGSCDMKSFLALALKASSGVDLKKLKRPLTLVATADEETTMSGARLIADNGKILGRFCVIGEPTSLSPIRQHKGNLTMSVEFVGQSGHASDPGLGNNALDGMYQFMTVLYAYRDKIQQQYNDPAFTIPTPTMNLGHIHGGDNSNRICGACTLLIDIRFLPAMSFATLQSDLEQLAAEVADKRGLQVTTQTFGDGMPAMDTDEASEIAQYLTHITGKKAGSVAFGTEAPYYNSMQTETIVIGPGSINQAHQPDEFLPLAHIDPTIKMLEDLIDRFCMS